jgi:hypothetical protein
MMRLAVKAREVRGDAIDELAPFLSRGVRRDQIVVVGVALDTELTEPLAEPRAEQRALRVGERDARLAPGARSSAPSGAIPARATSCPMSSATMNFSPTLPIPATNEESTRSPSSAGNSTAEIASVTTSETASTNIPITFVPRLMTTITLNFP